MSPIMMHLLVGSALVSALVLPTAVILITMRLGVITQIQGRITKVQEKKPEYRYLRTFVLPFSNSGDEKEEQLREFCARILLDIGLHVDFHSVQDMVVQNKDGFVTLYRTILFSKR